MDKVKDNKLSSVRDFFFKELENYFDQNQIKSYFEYCCLVWLNLEKIQIKFSDGLVLSESEILLFLYGVKDLKKHRPIQYVTGKAFFYGLEFYVKEGVLNPRPETEELVDLIVKENHSCESILDIGSGSGCIPITLDLKFSKASVESMDVSEEALVIANRNNSLCDSNVSFFKADALNPEEWPIKKYDVLVSNPPYITEDEKELMHENVLEFEPTIALFVPNEDPLLFYRTIGEMGLKILNPSGKIYFEINENYGEAVCKLLFEQGYYTTLIQDMQGKDRIVKAVLKDE